MVAGSMLLSNEGEGRVEGMGLGDDWSMTCELVSQPFYLPKEVLQAFVWPHVAVQQCAKATGPAVVTLTP